MRRTVARARTCALWRPADKVCMYACDKVCMYAPHACPRSHMCTVACSLVCVYAVISERYGILRRLYTRTYQYFLCTDRTGTLRARKVSQSLAKYLCDQYTGTSIVNVSRQSGKRLMPKGAFNYVRTFVNMCRDHMSENTDVSKGTCACACALAYMCIPCIHVHMHVHVCTSIYMHI